MLKPHSLAIVKAQHNKSLISRRTDHVEIVTAFSRYCVRGLVGEQRNGLMADGDASSAHSHKLQSSPGYLQVGHVPSKWTWQMPHTSSSGMSHRQVATVFHFLIVTFIVGIDSMRPKLKDLCKHQVEAMGNFHVGFLARLAQTLWVPISWIQRLFDDMH